MWSGSVTLAAADEAELGEAEEFRSLAWAQVHLLRAIYHELRHGNDQAIKLAKENADALSEHADTMDHMSSAMNGLATRWTAPPLSISSNVLPE